MEVFLGPPTTKTNLALWGAGRLKEWWWFLAEGVPWPRAPLAEVPPEARSTHHDRDGIPLDKLKLTRGITPVSFAVAHVACWKQVVIEAQTQPMVPGAAMTASYHHMIEAARARLTLWSSSEPSICSRLTDASIFVERCIIVPIFHRTAREIAR